jgi:hypothetical protein
VKETRQSMVMQRRLKEIMIWYVLSLTGGEQELMISPRRISN